VLQSYMARYPHMVVGLSDHTPGHSTVLGAIALGARVIEKHFTDDNSREGPDHPFSMNPASWREMIDRSQELELGLGDGIKRVEKNEKDTVIVQQRCLRLVRDMKAGERLTKNDIEALRPAPQGSLRPYQSGSVIGKTLMKSKAAGDALYAVDINE
jgi:sialic acid synthase SpsE